MSEDACGPVLTRRGSRTSAGVAAAVRRPAEAAGRAAASPGPRKTRPARSRQLAAACTSLAIAAYSWVATRSGL